MTEANITPPMASFILTGWHVLAIFVVFFGIVFAVNTVFMMRAYSTFPGEVSEKPYEDGLAYNSEIATREAAKALGWKAQFVSDRTPDGANLSLKVLDRDAKPVSGLKLAGAFARPATTQGTQAVRLIEAAPGVYEAHVKADPGLWELDVKSPAAGGRTFESESRVVLK